MLTSPNEVQICRWMYADSLAGFLQADPAAILGALLQHSQGAVEPTQRDAWLRQIDLLRACHWTSDVVACARIYLEFTVPRLGRRVDTVLLTDRGLVLVEFKVGAAGFTRSALDQGWDYGLDFKHFHEASHAIAILPVLVATQAPAQVLEIGTSFIGDGLTRPLCAAPEQLPQIVNTVRDWIDAPTIDADAWERGRYLPTTTIVEAARALYAGHAVAEISRSDAGAAKRWLRGQARGSERFGVVVSWQAERLKPLAIDIRVKTDPVKWFLDGKDDTRSSYYLEDVATEFQVQGLELDWVCVVWDGDLRFAETARGHHEFRGSRWMRIQKPERRRYLENAYRVLLTRARQGMVIVVPEGSADDPTRQRLFYDPTFEYLQALGMRAL
ncbi:MAG: DNA/RNA helicase domain-containing protein [Rubrivivax sp.]